MSICPLKLSMYKGVSGRFGAVQFHFQKPHYYCEERGCRIKDFDSVLPKNCTGSKDNPHAAREMKSREGCIFMDITSATGPNVYDWDKKIVLALSIQDIMTLLYSLEVSGECKLTHDPNMKGESQGKVVKSLNVSSPKGIREGCLLNASMKEAGKLDSEGNAELIKHTVPLSGAEVRGLSVYLRHALIAALGWT